MRIDAGADSIFGQKSLEASLAVINVTKNREIEIFSNKAKPGGGGPALFSNAAIANSLSEDEESQAESVPQPEESKQLLL